MGKQHREPVQAILTNDGEVTDDQQMAEAFNKYFTGLFVGSTTVSQWKQMEGEYSEGIFQFSRIAVEDTLKVLQSLDVNKFTGLDGITSKCLHVAAPAIAGCLSHLFNLSLANGVFPKEWKTMRVTPIFKAGSRLELSNYCPISVLPLVAKVFE